MNDTPTNRGNDLVPLRWGPMVLSIMGSVISWGVLFAALPPGDQDFPLGDDWAFSRGVFLFAKGQGIHYSQWASMPQLGQWFWALPFIWGLGASHVALRCSTIALSWLGIVAFFDLLRQDGFSPRQAVLMAVTLSLNPIFFLCQGTFMTDVPALSLGLLALALFNRSLKSGRVGWLAGAAIAALLATMTRQNMVIVPVIVALLWWRSPGRRYPLVWLLAVMVPIVMGVGTSIWFFSRSDIISLRPMVPALRALVLFPFLAFHLGGLTAIPPLLLNFRSASWRRWGVAFILMSSVALFLGLQENPLTWKRSNNYFPYGGLFPYCHGVLSPYGAFSPGLVAGSRETVLGLDWRLVLTLTGCVAGAALVQRFEVRAWLEANATPLGLFSLLQIPFILVAPNINDRYFLVLMPGAIYLAGSKLPVAGWRWLPATAALLGLGVVSVCLMHDWLAWNSARWKLGRRALARQIDPQEIEGGFEWNGWFSPTPRIYGAGKPRRLTLPFTLRFAPQVTGRFALSFSELPETVTLDSEPYSQWLLGGHPRFLFLQENATRPSQRDDLQEPQSATAADVIDPGNHSGSGQGHRLDGRKK